MQIRIDVSKAKQALKRTEKVLKEALVLDATQAKIIGEEAKNTLRIRTRLGKDRFNKKLMALEKSTIYKRERSNLSPETEAKRSNLTMTGQLLEAMYVNSRDNFFEIKFKESRRGSSVKNSELVQYHREGIKNKKGKLKIRDFFGYSPFEVKSITRKVNIYLIKKIRAIRKRRG